MAGYLLKRLGEAAAALVVVSVAVFCGVYAIGDPLALLVPPDATAETEARIAAELGLDRSLPAQYWAFVTGALSGDLGVSFFYREPALAVIAERLPATLELAAVAMLIAVLAGVPLGLWAGLHPGSVLDRAIVTGSVLGFSVPTFMVGLVFILVFAVVLGWLPSGGRGATVEVGGVALSVLTPDGWSHLILPALNLALFPLAFVVRLARTGMREVLSLDFVRFARAQGLSRGRVVRLHVLKYVAIPIVTLVGLQFGILIAFAVVTEQIFAWPGMGKLLIEAINQLDRPLIVAYVLMVSLLFIVINLAVDLAYGLLDPRARLR